MGLKRFHKTMYWYIAAIMVPGTITLLNKYASLSFYQYLFLDHSSCTLNYFEDLGRKPGVLPIITLACTEYCHKVSLLNPWTITCISGQGQRIQLGSFLKFLDGTQLKRRVNVQILQLLISLNKSLVTVGSFSLLIMPNRKFFLQKYNLTLYGHLFSSNRKCHISNLSPIFLHILDISLTVKCPVQHFQML